jgi:hypothetical protein
VSSSCGEILTAAATFRGLTVTVDTAEATNNYDVELISDPTGARTLIGSALTLTAGNRTAKRRDQSAAIVADTEIGARVVLSSGSGASTFSDVVVVVELSIP